jgi:glyoxylase-like metal-dependent hydrolase (beta-lactamase superfamily II)
MEIKHIVTGPIAVNTFIVINRDKCIVIDPGGNYKGIMDIVGCREVSAVLLTHGHFDHIGALYDFYSTEIPVYIHSFDRDKLNNQKLLGLRYGVKLYNIDNVNELYGGEKLHLAGLKIDVIHTPGHSKGSVVYVIGNSMFTGDTLFLHSYGRTDIMDGDQGELRDSITNKLFSMTGDYSVYPGHEGFTTLDSEKRYNPINYD